MRFLFGAIHGRWAALAQAPTEEFYLWGRAVTALFGTATVWLLYRTGLRWNRRTALLAAVMLAVMPLHVRESHYTLTDVPATFFVVAALLLALRAHERSTASSFALAGAAAGLAGATKYNAGVVVVVPLIASAMTRAARPSALSRCCGSRSGRSRRSWWRRHTRCSICRISLNGFARLASDYRAPLAGADPVWVRELKWLRISLGWPGSLIVITGVSVAVWRAVAGTDRLKWLLAVALPLAYLYFVAGQNIFFARYLMPLVPCLSLLGAAGIVWVVDQARRLDRPPLVRQAIVLTLTLLAIVPPAYSSIQFNVNELRSRDDGTAVLVDPADAAKRDGDPLRGQRDRAPAGRLPGVLHETAAAAGSRHLPERRDPVSRRLVANLRGVYLDDPRDYPEENRQYRQLFAQTDEIARFTGSREHPGPELRVLRIKSADTAR